VVSKSTGNVQNINSMFRIILALAVVSNECLDFLEGKGQNARIIKKGKR
jgi:hypothetical protein